MSILPEPLRERCYGAGEEVWHRLRCPTDGAPMQLRNDLSRSLALSNRIVPLLWSWNLASQPGLSAVSCRALSANP